MFRSRSFAPLRVSKPIHIPTDHKSPGIFAQAPLRPLRIPFALLSLLLIAAAGWGEQFGHGLGHGIGLEVHEAPAVRAESTDTLEAGNVVSCEPGIYLPGVGGVRIEDMVLVTDDGSERLTQAGKELITVR